MIKVYYLDESNINWSFNSGQPYMKLCRGSESIDPFPCYSYDMALVEEISKKCGEVFPVNVDVNYYVLGYDSPSYVNAHADAHIDYWLNPDEKDENKKPWHGDITVFGKRTPIHPAHQAYVISHEYGHIVESFLRRKIGQTEDDFMDEYRKIHSMPMEESYGGRNWHISPQEIFANDFRILVANIETQFWPHPTVQRPNEIESLYNWWAKQKEDLKERQG